MDINASDLIEVLAIVNQYETDAYIFASKVTNGRLFIDGTQAVRKMTPYERSVIIKHGFEFAKGGGLIQAKPKKQESQNEK